jgi:hypothetical protein
MAELQVIRNFIDTNACNTMIKKLDSFYQDGLDVPPDNQCPNSPTFYGIFNDESLEFLPRIEKLTGKELYPTYTYSRIYQKGEMLLPHIDRWEAEYSFTLTLKYDKEAWPFYVQTEDGVQSLILEPGDIVIYKGLENLHWRLGLENEYHYQAFFHYVDKNGPYAQKRYDGRHDFATTADVVNELNRRKQ